MNIKQTIASLSLQDLKQRIADNFLKVGITLRVDSLNVKQIAEGLYVNESQLWLDTFDDLFTKFSFRKLYGMENKAPHASALFIIDMKNALFSGKKKRIEAEEKVKYKLSGEDTNQKAYINFIKHTIFYRTYPVDPNWLKILAHLVDKGHLKYYAGWDNVSFMTRSRDAECAVKRWTKENIQEIMRQLKATKAAT